MQATLPLPTAHTLPIPPLALSAPRSGVPVPAGDATTLELLCFRAAGQEFGLPLQQVQELRRLLPGQAALMAGAQDLGGDLLPLLDLGRLLGAALRGVDGLPAVVPGARAAVVMAKHERRLCLVVDEVLGVQSVSASQLRALPALPCEFARRHLLALVSVGMRRVLLLSADTWMQAYFAPQVVRA